jgi:hypothetical protein
MCDTWVAAVRRGSGSGSKPREWQVLAKLVPGPPEGLAVSPGPEARLGRAEPVSGGRGRGADEGSLADAGLAPDEHCVTAALGELS